MDTEDLLNKASELTFAIKEMKKKKDDNPFVFPSMLTKEEIFERDLPIAEAFVLGDFWPKKQHETRHLVLGYIEEFFQENETLPTKAQITRHFEDIKDLLPKDKDDWDDFLESLTSPLQARGIFPYVLPTNQLEPRFVLACNLICDPLDTRAQTAKLKEAGLTTKQWKHLLNQEKYFRFYEQALDQIFDQRTRAEAKRNLSKMVENGDLAAIKYYEERQNIYRPNNHQDIQQVLIQMVSVTMEILAKHVTQEVLQKVAFEFQERNIIDTNLQPSLPVGN